MLTPPIKDMMTRAAWRANIAALIQHTELTDTLQDLYRSKAQEVNESMWHRHTLVYVCHVGLAAACVRRGG